MSIHTNNTVPLQQVLPFSSTMKRNLLICDSVGCKGDFVCKTMAVEILNASTRVLWLSGDANVTQLSLATQLKRMGCDVLRSQGRQQQQQQSERLRVRNVVSEMADQVLESNDTVLGSTEYLKQVYKETKEWILNVISTDDIDGASRKQSSPSPSWIILDDVSGMAAILGDKIVYQFVDSLLALSHKQHAGLIIRCSSDIDQMIYKQKENEANHQYAGWIGSGGLSHQFALQQALQTTIPCLERSLPTKVDAIVDVLPLPSGFSRDAHGRLIFSETSTGRGWGASGSRSLQNKASTTSWNKLIVNYCVHNTGVRVMRLRTAVNA